MADGTEVGKIHLGVEIEPELSDGDPKGQLAKISKILEKGLANLKGAFKLQGLDEAFETCFKHMNTVMVEQIEAAKNTTRNFIEDISKMLENAKFRFHINYSDQPQSDGTPKQPSRIPSKARAPPLGIKMPKIDLSMDDNLISAQMSNIRSQIDLTTKKISNQKDQLAKYQEELLNLKDVKAQINAASSEMQGNKDLIKNLTAQKAALKSSMSDLGSLSAKLSLNEEIKALDSQINLATKDIDYLKQKLSELNHINADRGISKVESKIRNLQLAMSNGEMNIAKYKAALASMQESSIKMPAMPEMVNPLPVSRGMSVALSAANALGGGITSLKAKLASLAVTALKSGLSGLSNGFKQGAKHAASFAGKILGVGTASKKAASGMGHANMGIGRLIRSFVIFSLIFPLVSQGIRSLGQSIGATLMTNETFAKSLDQIKSNLMAAFMPIYNAVLPALNALMSALANITAHIAAFVSSLFGSTYSASINAAKGMVAAKDAMGAYGSAAKKAAKDANASVMAFDNLNKLNSKNDSDSGGGAPNIIPTDIDTSSASSFADKIKKMFADQDYEGIGQMIGNGINKGIAKITRFIGWSNVGGKITAVIDGFSRIFNSAVATINWDAAGKMVGTGVNTLANTVKMFFEKINWELLGQSLAKGLNGLVNKVDWTNLGQTWGSYLMARINGLYGFVTTANWAGIGKALADGVMGLANYVDWGKFGTLVGTSIQGVVSTVHNFVDNIDWRGLGSKIASSLNNFFSSVNWGEMGLTLSNAARGILNTLRKALADFDFVAIGQDIANFLCNIDWLGLLLDVGVIIARAFIGLSATIMSGVSQLALNIVDGFFNGIAEFFGDPLGWIKKHIVDPFINAIKDLFGIHSPSTVMAEIGGYLIQGLLNGIKNLIPNLLSSIGSWFGGIGSTIKDTWDGVKTWTNETWTSIKTKVGDKVNQIKTGISDGFGKAKDAVVQKCSDIKTSVTTKFGEVTSWIGGLKDDLWSKAKETFNKYCEGVGSVDVKGTVQKTMSGVLESVQSVTGQASTWGSDMMQGMASGIKSASSWVTDAVSGVASKIASWLHFSRPDVGPLREYEKWMPDMMQGLSNTLQAKTPVLLNSVKSLAASVSTAMQDIQPSVAFTGRTTSADQYNTNYVNSDDMILSLLKEIVGLLKKPGNSGGSTSTQEIVVKIGDTEMARVVIAAIKKYEKETGRQVLVS